MDTSNEKMKWILFWVFISLFILAVLGTLSVVFLGMGSPTETEREWLVKGLILEVAACVIALFFSIFGLKKSNESNSVKVLSDLEIRVKELEEKLFLSTKEIDHSTSSLPISIDSEALGSGTDLMDINHPSLAKIMGLTTPPAFDEQVYNINPSYPEIITDIKNAKPFDKKHRLKSYIGLKVQWKCAFSGFDEKEDCFIIRVFTEEPMHIAYLNIDKSKNVSKLKVLNENYPFWVCGEISEITVLNIELVNADISV